MKNSETFDIQIDDELFTVEYTAYYDVDNNYGSDIDGRRGVKAVFLEDIQLDHVMDSIGNDITDKLKNGLNANLRQILEDECIVNENK